MRAHTSGSFAVYSKATGQDITPRGRKARALLAYLISERGSKVPKARMAALFWGDRGDAQARSSLRQVIAEIKRSLNETQRLFFSDQDHLWVRSDLISEEQVDWDALPKDPFEDLDNITPAFDEWLAAERSRRLAARLTMLKTRAEDLLGRGLAAGAAEVVDVIQRLDPTDEDAVRIGMKAEFERGRAGKIVKRFEVAAAVLKTELGVEPSAETRALLDELLSASTVINRSSRERCGALYEAIERHLKMGGFEFDLVSGDLWWTPGMFALFGIPPGSIVRREDILKQYDPESRKRLEAHRNQAISTGMGFSIELDVVTREAVKHRLRVDAAVETRNGQPVRLLGTHRLIG